MQQRALRRDLCGTVEWVCGAAALLRKQFPPFAVRRYLALFLHLPRPASDHNFSRGYFRRRGSRRQEEDKSSHSLALDVMAVHLPRWTRRSHSPCEPCTLEFFDHLQRSSRPVGWTHIFRPPEEERGQPVARANVRGGARPWLIVDVGENCHQPHAGIGRTK